MAEEPIKCDPGKTEGSIENDENDPGDMEESIEIDENDPGDTDESTEIDENDLGDMEESTETDENGSADMEESTETDDDDLVDDMGESTGTDENDPGDVKESIENEENHPPTVYTPTVYTLKPTVFKPTVSTPTVPISKVPTDQWVSTPKVPIPKVPIRKVSTPNMYKARTLDWRKDEDDPGEAVEHMTGFLHVMIPLDTIHGLILELRKQWADGLLRETRGKTIASPTPELRRLAEILQGEFNEKILLPSIVIIEFASVFMVNSIGKDGPVYILCIESYLAGGAYWTDLERKCEIEGNTLLKVESGYLDTDENDDKGGVYLLLVSGVVTEFEKKHKYDVPLELQEKFREESNEALDYTPMEELD